VQGAFIQIIGGNMLKIGCARTDITVFEPGMGLLGWAYRHNVVTGVAMPLCARAFVLEQQDGGRVAIVVAEVGFITQGLRQAVVDELERRPALGLSDERIMLTATHTHSGPSGFSHVMFYSATSPGYSAKVFGGLVQGIVSAVEQAVTALVPGRVGLKSGRIPLSEPVAFNRAIRSYESNHDVVERTGIDHSPAAIDREMTVLRFDDASGRPLGMISWFGVHGTSVHRENLLLHPDNKGMAAAWFERYAREGLGVPGFVAAFAQSPCGDVTPNRNFSLRRGLTIGEHKDDFESARRNGEIQARFARQLFDSVLPGDALAPRLDAALLTADFANLAVDPAFADGRPGRHTSPAVVGLRMIFGTSEGPGLPYVFAPLVESASRASARLVALAKALGDDSQAPKLPLFEAGLGTKGKALGFYPMNRPFPIPDDADPTVGFLNRSLASGAVDERPWVPQVLPAQIIVIGGFAIAATAGELTTVAGRRLRAGLLDRLKGRGVRHIVSMPYSNTYSGYITTPEEYQCQGYEGGHTLFGRWTLGGHRTLFDRVAARLLIDPADRGSDRGPVPPRADPALLRRWAYVPRP
jgi:neutral ceramidase